MIEDRISQVQKFFIQNEMFAQLRGFNAAVRMFGAVADSVNKAIHERMNVDGAAYNLMKPKAAGEDNPRAYMRTLPRAVRRRGGIASVAAHPSPDGKQTSAARYWELSKTPTQSPTNPRNYVYVARNTALQGLRRYANSPIEEQRTQYGPIYQDMLAHKGTPQTREVMKEAMSIVQATEAQRAADAQHGAPHLRPTIHAGSEFPYRDVDWNRDKYLQGKRQ